MRYLIFIIAVFCVFNTACAQMLADAKPIPTNMADSSGNALVMDFSINLEGIKDANMPFSVFSSRPLMIYYFSPFCPHCKKGYGGIQKIAKEYEQKGLASIAVSVGNISKRDIMKFMEDHNASIVFFQDKEFKFGQKYGDGYVPRLYLVSSDGKIIRYTEIEEENIKSIKSQIEKIISN